MSTNIDIVRSFERAWNLAGKSRQTSAGYAGALRMLRDHLGGTDDDLLAADRPAMEAYVEGRMLAVSANAAQYDVRAFKAFFRWAAEEGEVRLDPAKPLKHPKVEEAPVAVATEQDYRRMVAACDRADRLGRRDAAIIAVLCWAGLRGSEVCSLDVDHVDLEAEVLVVPRSKVGRPREIRLHPEATSLIDRWLRVRGDTKSPALFVSKSGWRLDPGALGQMFVRRRNQAGVDPLITAHAFRRGLATTTRDRSGGRGAAANALASPGPLGDLTYLDRFGDVLRNLRVTGWRPDQPLGIGVFDRYERHVGTVEVIERDRRGRLYARARLVEDPTEDRATYASPILDGFTNRASVTAVVLGDRAAGNVEPIDVSPSPELGCTPMAWPMDARERSQRAAVAKRVDLKNTEMTTLLDMYEDIDAGIDHYGRPVRGVARRALSPLAGMTEDEQLGHLVGMMRQPAKGAKRNARSLIR